MALTDAVQWWEEWQMRILVLGSLFVYLSLYFADLVRKSPSLRKFRFLVWSAYVGSDALAIYALATLFNRQRQRSACGSRGSSDLEVLWAPVLLIHLGGQPTLSAYSLEDNELWLRHAMTLVSQVTVALYIFCIWWSGERRLLNAAVLLFVVGIIKFSHKPWALRRASFTSMLISSALEMQRKREKQGWVGRCWRLYTGYWMDVFSEMTAPPKEVRVVESGEQEPVEDGVITTLEAFIERVRRYYGDDTGNGPELFTGDPVYTPVTFLYKMFVNLALPYNDRFKEVEFFLLFSEAQSYKLLQECLYSTYNILYTRRRVTFTFLGMSMQLSLPFLTLTSVVLFIKSHKGGYDVNDVWVTYILFCFTALHEFLPFVPFGRIFSAFSRSGRWHDMVSQGSLLRFCAHQEANKFTQPCILKEMINKYCHVEQEVVAKIITQLVRSHIKDGWKKYIKGPISYRGFNDLRGQWTLEKYRHKIAIAGDNNNASTLSSSTPEHSSLSVLESSLTGPFDESILKWHVATDLCYYKSGRGSRDGNNKTQEDGPSPLQRARWISNYMAYLLFICPEILVPGARPGLFIKASDLIAEIIKNRGMHVRTEEDIANLINSSSGDDSVFPKEDDNDLAVSAKKLAEALGDVDKDDRWELIEGVWVEMLCFSAARCSGYLHARTLGYGGEFLSYIWLLWSAMGMETLADKIIISEPPGEAERKQEEEKAIIKRQQREQSLGARARDGGSSIASSSRQVEVQVDRTTVDISPYPSTA